jgi:hypothetical protein
MDAMNDGPGIGVVPVVGGGGAKLQVRLSPMESASRAANSANMLPGKSLIPTSSKSVSDEWSSRGTLPNNPSFPFGPPVGNGPQEMLNQSNIEHQLLRMI